MSTEALRDKDVVCLGHLQRAFKLVDRLHDVGCERDVAGNRQLFYSDYIKLVLLYTWNPLIDSRFHGIVRDAVACFEGVGMVRRIEIKVTPHLRRTGSAKGEKLCERIILYTSLLDMPAELIGLIYRYRYVVEHFFFVLKQMLGLRHLLSQRQEGIDIQIYCAMIVCVLIQLISGKKPNKAIRSMVGWYLLGLATEEDLINFLNKPDNKGVKLRAKEELLKKMGF
jgi:hypothetical protein